AAVPCAAFFQGRPMQTASVCSRLSRNLLLYLALLIGAAPAPTQPSPTQPSPTRGGRAGRGAPPKGFTALFNGKDLSGWHGMPHFNPYKLDAMPEAERKANLEKWTEDANKHWRVEDGELINDGKGAYLTTDKEYGDIELLIEYR